MSELWVDERAQTQSGSRPRHPWTLMAVLAGALSSYALIQSVTVPTLPLIQEEFGADQATANWILVAFFLSASIATPILGRVGDSYGRRRVFVFSLSMICLGALVASLAPNIETMIVARAIQGIGGGAIPLSFALIRDHLPTREVAGTVGFAASLIPLGYAAGIVIAGPLTELVGLPGLFLLPALAISRRCERKTDGLVGLVGPREAPNPSVFRRLAARTAGASAAGTTLGRLLPGAQPGDRSAAHRDGMNEPTSASTAATAGTGSTMTEPAASPYDAPPTWTPGGPPPTYAGPAAPATPAPGFRDRVFKLWHALVVAAACLIVGLGFGVLIGHETASGSGSDGFRPPGIGQGPGGQGTDGQGLGRGPGGQGNGQGLGPGFGQGFGQGQSGSGSGTSGGTSS